MKIKSYYDGDFTAVLELLRPQITVISDLLNSIKKNKYQNDEKYEEILETLPSSSICIWYFPLHLNKSKIKNIILKAEQRNINILPIISKSQFNLDISILVDKIFIYDNVNIGPNGISFSLNLNKKIYHVNTKLLSEECIAGIIASIVLAKNAGFNLKDVIRNIEKMDYIPGYMAPFVLKNNALILDNSAAVSVGSLISAINSLKLNNGKKTIIISSFYDMHDFHDTDISKLIKLLFSSSECIIFLDKLSYDLAQKHYLRKKYSCMLMYENIPAVSEFLGKVLINQDDIALLIGKETGILIERLNAHRRV